MSKVHIKADDFRFNNAKKWESFLDACAQEGVPVGVGVIARNLIDKGIPGSVRSRLKMKNVEVWNHGDRHWREEDTAEFLGPSVEEQVKAIKACQKACRKVIGIRPKWFGAPFNLYDANTIDALKKFPGICGTYDIPWHPDIKSLPSYLNITCDVPDTGRKFGLDRAMKLSRPFIRRRQPLIVQVHPGNHWEDACIGRFRTYVKWMKASGYEFVFADDLMP